MIAHTKRSRRTSVSSRLINSKIWRIALLATTVFSVAVMLGYTTTAAGSTFFDKVVGAAEKLKPSRDESPQKPTDIRRVTFSNNRDLNLPLSTHSLLSMFEATVSTDKADYRPGETAIITGSGFWANEIVTLQVIHSDGGEEGGAGHDPWNVIADSSGGFTTSWFVNPDDSLGATFLLTAVGNSSGLTAQTTFTDKPGANLDQCANGGVGDPPEQCIGSAWQNGNLNQSGAHYLEGDSVPYRAIFTDLTAGATYTTTIEYDTTQSGKHATDYLTTFSTTEVTADPCTGVAGVPSCGAPTTFPIPLDPNVSGAGVTQLGGQNFTIYNGTITGVSAYTLTGTYAGTSQTSIVVTFTATASGTAVMAWGGHISTRLDWGVSNSAIAISGSPYHMRLIDFTCSNVSNCGVGNQDRSLSADAIFFPATLNITKVTDPTPQQTAKLFSFTGTGTNVSNFSLDDDPNTATSNVKSFNLTDTSQRTIVEANPAPEFSLTNLVCTQIPDPQLNDTGTVSTNLGTRTVTVTPAEGETINCTFTNTEDFNATQGRIKVVKQTVPDGSSQSFTFNASYDIDGFTLTDGQSDTSTTLLTTANGGGPYTVSENAVAGWDSDGGVCDNGTPSNITVVAGQTTTCTFTNTQQGSIKVVKNTVGGDGSFDFTSNFGLPASITTSSGTGMETVNNLVPGNGFSVSETVPTGWDLATPSCALQGGGTTGSAGASGVTGIVVEAGKTTTCTFTNTKRGKIIVEKQTTPNGAAGSFTFTGDAAGSISDGGTIEVANLVPGTYSSTETNPAPAFDLTNITCDDANSTGNVGTRTATFNVEAGETVKCTFTNTQRGTIIVEKQTNPDGATGSFTFTGQAAGTISDNGQIVVPNLVPGTYTSTENDPTPAFDLTSITCNDGNSTGNTGTRTATFRLEAGETVKCTFTNTQRGMVEVLKLTNGAVHPEFDINFTLYRDGPDTDPDLTNTDTQLENLSTLNDVDGVLKFTTKLVPGTTYTVCENPVPAGWTSMWMLGGNIVTPYNPNGNDTPPQDVGVRCVDFTVTPGQTLSYEVHNDVPGGDPRTIGYWKNWNRCTGGGQAANAANNGGAAAGFFLLEDLLPQLIGDFNITTCAQGVKVLGKQDQNGKSKSSDAAYELAAQLLAAKLNLAAGAETCTAVQTAVTNGQALLDLINFTGSGDYLGSKVKGAQATQRAQALSLANTLDQYNNGNLCP